MVFAVSLPNLVADSISSMDPSVGEQPIVNAKVLVIDDDPLILRLVRDAVESQGMEAVTVDSGADGLRQAAELRPQAIVLDLGLPDVPGRELLRRFSEAHSEIPVIVFTTEGGVDAVVECMQLGALDYVQKPLDRTRLMTSLRIACEQSSLRSRVASLTRALRADAGFGSILGESPAVEQMRELLRKAAGGAVTVLLLGESGTGKEVAARAIHAEGKRCASAFVTVDCGGIPDTLIESELFGHEKGAFTGAVSARRGRFEEADGGTIFLDEIGELRIDLQSRLLRVLQERVVQRVGGGAPKPVDIRVIAATNRDLKKEIASGGFREDLFYRLSVFPVEAPPLRARGDDVVVLARACLARFSERYGKRLEGFTAQAEAALRAHNWPGNVRELENALERAVILEEGPRISLGSLTDELVCALDEAPAAAKPISSVEERAPAIRPFAEEESAIISRALIATGWNVQAAASLLGIGRATIYRKIERYGLKQDR